MRSTNSANVDLVDLDGSEDAARDIWHYLEKIGDGRVARCGTCGNNYARGKDGCSKKSWGNGGLLNHLKTHKAKYNQYRQSKEKDKSTVEQKRR